MRFVKTALLATTLFSSHIITASADVNVVASIKPVHSLVSAVMKGAGTPSLLVEGAGSPHTYALKPSQAKNLQEADLIFWVSPNIESFLESSIEGIAKKALAVELIETKGLTKLKFREGGNFDAHDHGDHDEHGHDDHGHKGHDDHGHDEHDEHDDHGHKDHDDHGHDEHDEHDDHGHKDHDDHGHDEHDEHDDHSHKDHDDHGHDEHDDHDEHGHGGVDGHVWLDPENAKLMVGEIAAKLSAIDPEQASLYAENAATLSGKLDKLIVEITAEVAPIKDKGYIVFHDAYHYFENRFGVSAVGSVTVSPEVLPGAQRISELQQKVREIGAGCVFSEPQFEPKLVTVITENTQAGTGVLDPLGADLKDGPNLYFTLIRNMAKSLKDCLMKSS